jgi:hypothetical protein
MTKRSSRQVRLEDEDASRAQTMGEAVTQALSAVDEMVRSKLRGAPYGEYGEGGRTIVAIRVFNNDKDIFTDGSTFCGVYDYTAQVCRDCTDEEWALAEQGAQQAQHL